ncbi:hypothetical protein DQ244_15075 [Blastococcus sp. TBT05-19]|uniref:hypothetical protein n=1 Tax=Blastococcus sp. TBT05-19 TaxID=2250581 RepID=UPI000DEBAC9F|nr:hypothetical protein [Blastococcus sp. TBT05-19]RBY89083.1 hypothetical protein DQ244_15075 [Blastococcus sp. TBT05-19]
MTAARPSEPARPVGATPVGGGNRGGGRRRGLLLGAALLAILLLVALLLSQCGSDDADRDPASSTGGSSSSSTSEATGGATGGSATASPSAGGGTAAGAGQIRTADGRSVLELAAGADGPAALAGVTGQPVTGTAVQVLSVPADEGFWVGTSETERVWVQLTGEAGESPYQVTEGDSVDFQGTVVAHAGGFAAQVGVDDAEGAAMLDGQGQHLEVAKSAVTLSE